MSALKNLQNQESKNPAKTRRNSALALLASLFSSSAFAAIPFASGSTTLTSDILLFVTPIVGIAVIAVGVLCWFGRISWMWLVGLIFGIILVFGNAQIVTWIRGLFGV